MDSPNTPQNTENTPVSNAQHAHADFFSAFRSPAAHATLWTIAVVGVVVDLWTKHWAFAALEPRGGKVLIPGALELRLSLNAGALFGMGAGRVGLFVGASVVALAFVIYLFAGSDKRQRSAHIALGLILAGALGNLHDRVWNQYDMLVLSNPAGGEPQRVFGAVLQDDDVPADAVRFKSWYQDEPDTFRRTDLAEEIRRIGVVRDFIKITLHAGETPLWPWVFNIADVNLVLGVILLCIAYWAEARAIARRNREAAARSASPAATESTAKPETAAGPSTDA